MITRFACSDCDDHDVRETTINKADYFNVLISVFSFHKLEWKNDRIIQSENSTSATYSM